MIWESGYILLRFDKTWVASTFQDFPNFHTHTFYEYKALDFIRMLSLYDVLAKIAQIIFWKETFYLHMLKVFRLQGLIRKLGLGGLIISGWSDGLDCEAANCHKDCFEGRVWIIELDCGVPIKTNQGSGVTFGTCLLRRSLALYPESPICIYNIISLLSWSQNWFFHKSRSIHEAVKLDGKWVKKCSRKARGVKYGGGST